ERERHVSVERLSCLGAAFHEVDRAPGELRVDQSALLEVVDDDFAALLALSALHDVHEGNARRVCGMLRWKHGLAGGPREAVPLAETLVVRQPLLRAAEMPFAEVPGGVA